MIDPILGFFKKLHQMPLAWIVWVHFLAMVNILGSLFFIDTWQGKLALTMMCVAFISIVWLFKKFGFVRLLGLGHFVWIPMIVSFIFYSGADLLNGDLLHQWLLLLITVNSISLIIDIVDVLRYLKGETGPTL